MRLSFMVKHQHHAHSFKLSKKSTAPGGAGGVPSPGSPTSMWSPPLLHHLELVSLSVQRSLPLRGGSGLCSASQVSIWLKYFLRFRNKRQLFFCFAGSKAWDTGLCRSIWHRKMLFAKGTDKLGQHQVGSASRQPCLGAWRDSACGLFTGLSDPGLVNPSKADKKRVLKTSVQKIL